MKVAVLGSQRRDPTVRRAAEALGLADGRIALVTAGWQEREPEDTELSSHLGEHTINLMLHRRADDIFKRDPEFAQAYRARQIRYRRIQDFYRIRLEYLIESAKVISHRVAPQDLLDEELQSSVSAIRMLDRHHQRQCTRVRNEFRDAWNPASRPIVQEHRLELREMLDSCAGLAIAGGHVASLLNRLQLLGIDELWGNRPLLGWSGGAMVLMEHVVLFHDSPPQGVDAPQLLDVGLARVDGLIVLPQPESRLRLDDRERMSMYARRFGPSLCLGLPRRSWAIFEDGRLQEAHGTLRVELDGTVSNLGEPLS